ncbi:CRAL/TRIO domain-containing protein [Colletotrichum tofieldiae]|nr:CRAL/TRIO domain-containing protein [Colletotrichum tofieldiae]
MVNGFFKLITPFIDPMTRDKLKFNEDMRQYVPEEQLWTEFSDGKLEFEYDHATYWPALNGMCKEKRDTRTARWVAGGKQIGELEDYLGGAVPKGVGSDGAAAAAAAAATAEAKPAA